MKRTDITKLFPQATEEQIKDLMDINGADINAAKQGLDDVKSQLAAAKSELESAKKSAATADATDALKKEQERAAQLENELNGLKLNNQLREMRATVAKEKGVPAELLTGDTEDDCKKQADGILAFANPSGYPTLPDAGEARGVSTESTRDQFANWAKGNL